MLKRQVKRIVNLIGKNQETELPFSGYPPANADFACLSELSDEELERLNKLLPWSSWVVDNNGRRFGNQFNHNKRNSPELIPDRRIESLNQRNALAGKHVLEIGCFEGNHTVALAQISGSVTAVDSRIENVVKTLTRCAMAGLFPRVYHWNVEEKVPSYMDPCCDVLHHVGVLYHLRDPVRHLKTICENVGHSVMLDTHVAPQQVELNEEDGIRFWEFSEHGRDNPFAGMYDKAKWLVLEDLVELLRSLGFKDVDVAEQREERNGPRVLVFASR